jgi:hypothetical protein
MFVNPLWPLFRPTVWEWPEFKMTGTSSFKYNEDNELITYEISIPDTIDEDTIKATIKDGILTLKMSKLVEKPVIPDDSTDLIIKRK